MKGFVEFGQIWKAFKDIQQSGEKGYIFDFSLRDILDRDKVLAALGQLEEACRARGIDTTGKTLGQLKQEIAKMDRKEQFG